MQTWTTEGYFRLEAGAILDLQLRHLYSALDDDALAWTKNVCGTGTRVVGVTEWVSTKHPCLSVGWDWIADLSDGTLRCRRLSLPRTNLMLLDCHKNDLGFAHSIHALARSIDAFDWADSTRDAIIQRHG